MTIDVIKLCECGCGQPAPIAKVTDTGRGWLKGQPKRFVSGHNVRRNDPIDESVPPKLCECGCGGYTEIATENDASRGKVRGQRMRCLPCHKASKGTIEKAFCEHAAPHFFDDDECWRWFGKMHTNGYGVFMYRGKEIYAHRASWEIHNGPIPDGLFVLHRCDNPPCSNPIHLFLGTQADNVADMVAKGRHYKQRGVVKE